MDKEKYEIYPIYIDKKGKWFECISVNMKIEFGAQIQEKNEILNIVKYLKKLDVIFPVLHGLYGEDGTIQGLF